MNHKKKSAVTGIVGFLDSLLCDHLLTGMGSKAGVEFQPLPVGHLQMRHTHAALSCSFLGLVPHSPFEDRISRAVEYFRDFLRIPA